MVISEKAVIGRINRKLGHRGEALKKSHGLSMQMTNGYFYTVNVRSNLVTRQHVNIARLAQELGVLRPFEKIGTNEGKSLSGE